MLSLVLRRLCVLPLLLLLAGMCGATLLRFAPGFDSDERELDTRWSSDSVARIREAQAANRNVVAYYERYLKSALKGDLGVSRTFTRPVTELLHERVPVTARLVFLGTGVAWIMGLGCALAAALWPRTAGLEICGTALTCILLSLPAALISILFLFWRGPLPLALGLLLFPRIYTYARNLLDYARVQPHVLQAYARGVGRLSILLRHVLPTALPQLGALAGVSINLALGAAIPFEALCDQPGIGQLAWQAALGRDLPLLVGLTLVISSVILIVNAVWDITREAAWSRT